VVAAGKRPFYRLLELPYEAALAAALEEFTQMFSARSESGDGDD
jgi:hypothetical protein